MIGRLFTCANDARCCLTCSYACHRTGTSSLNSLHDKLSACEGLAELGPRADSLAADEDGRCLPSYSFHTVSKTLPIQDSPAFPSIRSLSQQSNMNPPSYSPAATPPAGLRIPASTTAAFPSHELTGPAPLRDLDGSAIFVASALVGQSSVHPCKVVAKEEGVTVYISYAGECMPVAAMYMKQLTDLF